MVRFGAEKAVHFDAQPDGRFAARYGAKQTLSHDTQNNLYVIAKQDGTRFEFFDSDQIDPITGGVLPEGSLQQSITATATIGLCGPVT